MLTLSVLHIRTMNDAIRLYMLAHRRYFILVNVLLVSFSLFIYGVYY